MSEREQSLVHEMMDFCFTKDVEYVTDLASYAERNRSDWAQALSNPVVYARMNKHLHAHSEK
jgi:hypothetical protein